MQNLVQNVISQIEINSCGVARGEYKIANQTEL